jgi:hypothetical protein
MGFKNKPFNRPIYSEQLEEPQRVIIISCEGRNTEPEYFKTIKAKLNAHISALLEIRVVDKEDNKSGPKDVINNLQQFIVDKYDYKGDFDEMWIVCDREKVEDRKKALIESFPVCENNNFSIALTNPLFEFWLLLHIVDITKYDEQQLHDNDYVSDAKKRRFIDKTLSDVLPNGFNKKKGKFNHEIVTMQNIKSALKQEALFANDPDEILDHLGSNIGDLIRAILPL